MHSLNPEDDVFLKPPLWEDITSSIQKLDPVNADMLGSLSIKMEPADEVTCNNNNNNHSNHNNNNSSFSNSSSSIKESNRSSSSNSSTNSSANFPSHVEIISASIKSEKLPIPDQTPPTSSSLYLLAPHQIGYQHHQSSHYHHHPQTNYKLYSSALPRMVYAPPPTPPSSDPGSPSSNLPRRTPPPPYPLPSSIVPSATVVATARTTPKYNRRNNPELEKRRIHHCDFIGKHSHSWLFSISHIWMSENENTPPR